MSTAQWGTQTKAQKVEIRGIVKRPGIGDLPYVEILLTGQKTAMSHGWLWSFECSGRQITTKSLYIYKSEGEAKRAAEWAANALLDLRVALESKP